MVSIVIYVPLTKMKGSQTFRDQLWSVFKGLEQTRFLPISCLHLAPVSLERGCLDLLCLLQVYEGLKPSDKFEKPLDYR